MRFSSLTLTAIKLIRPGTTMRALLGKLMECLADENGPGEPSVHPKRLAAALYHGSDTGVFLDVGGVSPARSVRTKYNKQAGSQLVSRPRETFQRETNRMRVEKFPE